MPASLFAFNYLLGPWEGCLNLNFENAELGSGFTAACTRDHLGVLWRGDPAEFENKLAHSHTFVRTLINAHSYIAGDAGTPLRAIPFTWLEVPDSSCPRITSGYMHQTLSTIPLKPDHPDCIHMHEAIDLVRRVSVAPAIQLALADLYAARLEVGPYSPFYCFRALEDVGFHFGTAKGDKPDWNAMNKRLNTSEQKWKPLTDYGTAARHLNASKFHLLPAKTRTELYALAREAVSLAIATL